VNDRATQRERPPWRDARCWPPAWRHRPSGGAPDPRFRQARLGHRSYRAPGPILDTGALAGACLDVTEPEPLPAGHPLWSRDDVVITPHVASRAELTGERRDALVRENLERFIGGDGLRNVVDRVAGY